MTDDITRGLALLADEAVPAPIDSHAVIAQARARTRNHRTVTAAFLAVVVIGVLTVTTSADRPTSEVAQQPEPPSQRLTAQLAAALPEVIPASWEITTPRPDDVTTDYPPHGVIGCLSDYPLATSTPNPTDGMVADRHVVSPSEPLTWDGKTDNCGTMMWYADSLGRIEIILSISNRGVWDSNPCVRPDCEEHVQPDGTRWRVRPDIGVAPGYPQQRVEALRPDGTTIMAAFSWETFRAAPPLTLDELVKFTEVFDY